NSEEINLLLNPTLDNLELILPTRKAKLHLICERSFHFPHSPPPTPKDLRVLDQRVPRRRKPVDLGIAKAHESLLSLFKHRIEMLRALRHDKSEASEVVKGS